MDMDLVIKNGKIVTASDAYEADIGIGNGKIVGGELRHITGSNRWYHGWELLGNPEAKV